MTDSIGTANPPRCTGRQTRFARLPLGELLRRWSDGNVVAQDWRGYQTEAAAFFRSLGREADTDVRMKGVRTYHDVDVVVRSHHVGFDIL